MLGFGWTEMLVIGVVALIVIGPKELPALMQKLGQLTGTVRRMGADFQREINRSTGLSEVRNLRTSITQPLKSTTDAIRKEFNTTTADGKVEPSGALKPAKAGSESVVEEIHAAAGTMPAPTPAEAMKEAVGKRVAEESAAGATAAGGAAATGSKAAATGKGPVKARRAPKAKAAPTTPVGSAELEPVPSTPTKPARKAKPVESPAPVEAVPSRAKAGAAKPADDGEEEAAKKPSGKPARKNATGKTATGKSAAKKPAAKKPAARKPTAGKS